MKTSNGDAPAPQDPPEFEALITKASARVQALTEAHVGLFRLDEASWAVDQDEGTITFTNSKGIRATAPVQIIGTYNTEDGTWLWGWDHPSVVPALAEAAATVKAYGDEHGVSDLVTRKLACSEDRCWAFTAVACELTEAQGAYRGPAGPALVFMTFGAVKLDKAPD